MGNLCGKESKDNNFAGPGRTLGSAPPPKQNARAPVPPKISGAKPAAQSQNQGRTIGAAGEGRADDPRSAAAKAAEARAQKAAGSGALERKVQEQRKQTQKQTLEQAAYENRAARDADTVAEARNYN